MKKYKYLLILLLTFFSFLENIKAITNINISNANLVPTFSKNITEYNVFVSSKTEIITITVNKEENETITGEGSKSLKKGLNVLEIISYTGDNIKEKYTLNIVRGEIINNKEESTLESLTIKNHDIDFDSNKFFYELDALEDENFLDITYTTLNPKVTVKLKGDINLNKEENIIELEVTSEDKSNTNIYKIKVNKNINKTIIENKEGLFDDKVFSNFELKLIRIGLITFFMTILSIIFYFLFIKKRANITLNISHNILHK